MRTLAAEQARLEGEVDQRERRLSEVRQASSRLPALQVELRHVQHEVAALAQVEAQQRELQALVGRAREEAAEKRTINAQLKKDMFNLREQLNNLDKLSACPTCRRAMDAEHKQRLRAEYVTQGTRLRDEFRTFEAICRELDATVARDEALLAAAIAALQKREVIHRRLAQAESQVNQADEAQRQLELLQGELADRRRVLEDNDFAMPDRRRLAELEKRIAALGYDDQRHLTLRTRAAELAGMDRERQLLEQARLSAEHLDAQIVELAANLKRVEEECRSKSIRRQQSFDLDEDAAAIDGGERMAEAVDLNDRNIVIAQQINTALNQPTSTRWLAILLGLFGMASTGRTLSRALTTSSCLAWQLPVRPKASYSRINFPDFVRT